MEKQVRRWCHVWNPAVQDRSYLKHVLGYISYIRWPQHETILRSWEASHGMIVVQLASGHRDALQCGGRLAVVASWHKGRVLQPSKLPLAPAMAQQQGTTQNDSLRKQLEFVRAELDSASEKTYLQALQDRRQGTARERQTDRIEPPYAVQTSSFNGNMPQKENAARGVEEDSGTSSSFVPHKEHSTERQAAKLVGTDVERRERARERLLARGRKREQPPPKEDTSGWGERAPAKADDAAKFRPEGSGYEVLLQAFNWESHRQGWWQRLLAEADRFAALGFTVVWLPPPTSSVSPQGYMPLDLYNLNSAYGSEGDLRKCVKKLQSVGLQVLADCVINHRCASNQDSKGVWNQFGGRMDWDASAVVSDDKKFRGRGGRGSGDLFAAAPNLDHAQPFVKADITDWLNWMRGFAGFDGWRFDFVKGYSGAHARDYVAATSPTFVVGEFWDALDYKGSVPLIKQDNHRQRTIDWINAAGGASTAFDNTTKGIMHAAFERMEYWRLRDATGKPPGVLGWWPSRTVTFLENHDTGSTQGHWRFPAGALEQGYCYILTHPGTPCVFYDHLDSPSLLSAIRQLIALRRRAGIHCRSKVKILKAEADVYAAEVMADDQPSLLMKIGPGKYEPGPSGWRPAVSGNNWQVWECTN